MLADVVMTQKAFDAAYSQPKNSLTFLDATPERRRPSRRPPRDISDAKYHTGAGYPKDATKEMASMLAMLYVLLGFSVIVSLFGMVNTMVLSVFERTREIGMLRTIGMTRSQARRMIRHESIITALIGAALGLGLGLFLVGARDGRVEGLPFPSRSRRWPLHAGRGTRGDRRGDPPRPPRLAAQRAGGAAIRVSARRGCLNRHRPPPADPIAPPGSRREA